LYKTLGNDRQLAKALVPACRLAKNPVENDA